MVDVTSYRFRFRVRVRVRVRVRIRERVRVRVRARFKMSNPQSHRCNNKSYLDASPTLALTLTCTT